ncbi:Mitochondrial inner membrane protease ATP23, partial [Nowakowskiella sp. JEL0078]
DTLTHELVHAYDYATVEYQTNNCLHHACTEIRAATLSGDCLWTREVMRGNWNFFGQGLECIKRRATLAVSYNPNCSGTKADDAVNKVFKSCINDTSPFNTAKNGQKRVIFEKGMLEAHTKLNRNDSAVTHLSTSECILAPPFATKLIRKPVKYESLPPLPPSVLNEPASIHYVNWGAINMTFTDDTASSCIRTSIPSGSVLSIFTDIESDIRPVYQRNQSSDFSRSFMSSIARASSFFDFSRISLAFSRSSLTVSQPIRSTRRSWKRWWWKRRSVSQPQIFGESRIDFRRVDDSKRRHPQGPRPLPEKFRRCISESPSENGDPEKKLVGESEREANLRLRIEGLELELERVRLDLKTAAGDTQVASMSFLLKTTNEI